MLSALPRPLPILTTFATFATLHVGCATVTATVPLPDTDGTVAHNQLVLSDNQRAHDHELPLGSIGVEAALMQFGPDSACFRVVVHTQASADEQPTFSGWRAVAVYSSTGERRVGEITVIGSTETHTQTIEYLDHAVVTENIADRRGDDVFTTRLTGYLPSSPATLRHATARVCFPGSTAALAHPTGIRLYLYEPNHLREVWRFGWRFQR